MGHSDEDRGKSWDEKVQEYTDSHAYDSRPVKRGVREGSLLKPSSSEFTLGGDLSLSGRGHAVRNTAFFSTRSEHTRYAEDMMRLNANKLIPTNTSVTRANHLPDFASYHTRTKRSSTDLNNQRADDSDGLIDVESNDRPESCENVDVTSTGDEGEGYYRLPSLRQTSIADRQIVENRNEFSQISRMDDDVFAPSGNNQQEHVRGM